MARVTPSPIAAPSALAASSHETKAAEIHQKAVQYNPKLDPKYDPMAGSGSSASSSLSASAYTTGSNIHLDPRAGKGESLIGHELTHVVQQGAGAPKLAR